MVGSTSPTSPSASEVHERDQLVECTRSQPGRFPLLVQLSDHCQHSRRGSQLAVVCSRATAPELPDSDDTVNGSQRRGAPTPLTNGPQLWQLVQPS